MSEGTGRWKSRLWPLVRHITGCYCTVKSFSQGSKEQPSNKQWFVTAGLAGSLSDVSACVNCMMIYEAQFLHQCRQTDSVAQWGSTKGKAASPLHRPSSASMEQWKSDFWIQAMENKAIGPGQSFRCDKENDSNNNNNPGVQIPWGLFSLSLFAFCIGLWIALLLRG